MNLGDKQITECFQQFAEAIQISVPEPWISAWIEASEIEEDSGRFIGDYTTPKGETKWMTVQPDLGEGRNLILVVNKLKSLMQSTKEETWKKVRFILEDSGEFDFQIAHDDE